MTTLADILHRTIRLVDPDVYDGTATGGTTATTIDAACPMPDDYFNGGLIYFTSGTSAGNTNNIVDWTLSTHTFLYNVQAAIVSGTTFVATRTKRAHLLAAINSALDECGKVTNVDASLTATASTWQYTLPSGVSNVRRVETYAANAAPARNQHWDERAGVLYFADGSQPTEGDTIRVFYAGTHAALSADTDALSDGIATPLVVWGAAYHYLFARSQEPTNNTPDMQSALKLTREYYQEMKARYPTRSMAIDPKIAQTGA